MDDFHEKLTGIRHAFHRDPELGFQEVRTKAKVADMLRDTGLDVHEGAGVIGILRAGGGNRAIGLRADMDALPISEISTHDYVSENAGVMHACVHFPTERRARVGRARDGRRGVLEQFPIDEVYAIHNLPGAPAGQISTRVGQVCASESLFAITINGHASMPHVGVDAITVGSEMVLALQTIVARKLAPSAEAVVSVTEFLTDGQRNVLPGHAT